jgi:hypothetical protein
MGSLITTFKGHTGGVLSAAFSSDGSKVVSASGDNTVKLWDVKTESLITTLEGHTRIVLSAAFSSDGSKVVSASEDKTVKLWDVKTGRLITTLEGHADIVWSVAFSPDGSKVVSASNDKTIKLWDVATGKFIVDFRSLRSKYFSQGLHIHVGIPPSVKDKGLFAKRLAFIGKSAEYIWTHLAERTGRDIMTFPDDSIFMAGKLEKNKTAFYLPNEHPTAAFNIFAPPPLALSDDDYCALMQAELAVPMAIMACAADPERGKALNPRLTGLPITKDALPTEETLNILRRNIARIYGPNSAGIISILQLLAARNPALLLPPMPTSLITETTRHIREEYSSRGLGDIYERHAGSKGWNERLNDLNIKLDTDDVL